MVSLEVIAILLSGISISASLFYYANILKNANTTREKELISQRLSTITPEFYNNTTKLFKGEWSTQLEWIEHLKEHPEDRQISSYIMVLALYRNLSFIKIMIMFLPRKTS